MSQDLKERIAALEATVRELRDREAIRELRYRYHECVNQGRWNELAELFTWDGELDFGYLGSASGREEIHSHLERGRELLSFAKQFIHNHMVEVSGDRGTGLSYLEAKSVSGDRAYVVAARYDDEYVRTAEGWISG